MFKKLKEKITEEVKSSPQRLQQFTQSVSDRLQQNSPPAPDESFFSLSEDDANASAGFSSVSLTSPEPGRQRRGSASSMASDVSFLPRYESAASMYHLQSDLEVSASEMEDNASTASSQLGHLTKEQIYSAFQKAQRQHHKYRGRYVDLARHYKELEREIAKMKQVLVDTQDKAIRRVSELKEQCSLEQKAKAHLENALRVELDEKQYKIETLQTQVGLLQNSNSASGDKHSSDLLVEVESNSDNGENNKENLELLRKYLNDARVEIENLNSKLQEMKANSIVFQSKESDYKNRIANFEREIAQYSEREKENNLKLAQSKMELHNELLAKDAELSNLRAEVEALKQPRDNRVENLQAQNKKLIEKVEGLTQKCNNYESELLKLEQHRIEVKNLKEQLKERSEVAEGLSEANEKLVEEKVKLQEKLGILEGERAKFGLVLEEKLGELQGSFAVEREELENSNANLQELLQSEKAAFKEKEKEFEEQRRKLEEDFAEQGSVIVKLQEKLELLEEQRRKLEEDFALKEEEFEAKLVTQRESAKKALLSLETRIKEQVSAEHAEKEEKIKSDFLQRIDSLTSNQDQLKDIQMKLFEKEDQAKALESQNRTLNDQLQNLQQKYKELEDNHLQLINEAADQRNEMAGLNKELEEVKDANAGFEGEVTRLTANLNKFQEVLGRVKTEKSKLEQEKNQLESQLEDQKAEFEHKISEQCESLKIELDTVSSEKLKSDDLVRSLREEKLELQKEIEKCREGYQNLLDRIGGLEGEKLKQTESFGKEITNLRAQLQEVSEKYAEQRQNLQAQDTKLKELESKYLNLLDENQNLKENALEIEELRKTVADLEGFKKKSEENERLVSELESKLQEAEKSSVELRNNENVLAEKLRGELEQKQAQLAENLTEQEMLRAEMERVQKENVSLQARLSEISNDNNRLEEAIADLQAESEQCKRTLENLSAEMKTRNSQLSMDNKVLTDENADLMNELSEAKIKLDLAQVEVNNYKGIADKIAGEKQVLLEEMNGLKTEFEKAQSNFVQQMENGDEGDLSALKAKTDALISENKDLKKQLENLERLIEGTDKQKSDFEAQLRQLEHQYGEILHEKQLLQDEVQELKISPLNLNQKSDNPKPANDPPPQRYEEEINHLHDKLIQYQSMDLTQKSSIEFYQGEVEKLKIKNEKLNRKLDETLVTLNHCAELSNSTEIEYLRNVLYNYMLGKESLVLARVIAAVCKFDEHQTDLILQKEQQKQSLLGQLGIL